jgi:hypothetical protein
MPCDECRDLATHAFRSADDMVHAVQTAAAETERGVLRRVHIKEFTLREREAIESAGYAGEVPGRISYAFECTVCGDRFALDADTAQGTGTWRRNDELPGASGR